ncbi:hypothetical protein IFM89_023421 [Coptis chinensis]|uniref:Leucine-rich repeat-containing N-terminal plant-type domain-containing protein n=1 Tax=Coptis chinensis TaxID=261450 RepID=A0A835LEZ1_9MAGN|nr:hypothetical protein IFM89_023421 [Coptis chinensis]
MASYHLKLLVYFLVLIVFVLFSSLHHVNSSSTSPREEAHALLNWKDSLHGETPAALSSWVLPPIHANSSHHCRKWFGISCNKAGKVVEINLTNTGLVGTLNSFPFSNLSNLNRLDLSINQLSGPIPP